MGASVNNVYIRVVMPGNGLRVNHYVFMALHSMWKLYTCRNSNQEQLRKIHQL